LCCLVPGIHVRVIPGHRAAMNPESRGSGFDALHRPETTVDKTSMAGTSAPKTHFALLPSHDYGEALVATDSPRQAVLPCADAAAEPPPGSKKTPAAKSKFASRFNAVV